MLQGQPGFVEVRGVNFQRDSQRYIPFGTNLWYGMHLGATEEGQARLIRELDRLATLGVNNLRIMASFEGPDSEPWRLVPSLQPEKGRYADSLLAGLDFFLVEMAKRQMTAVVCLGNFWPWSGGFGQYVVWEEGGSIPYPPPADGDWIRYMLFASRFYTNPHALETYRKQAQHIITRTNSLNGLPYREDPTIMAWELANEPRGMSRIKAYKQWVYESSAFIKQLDANHLVTIGSEGSTPSRLAGTRFKTVHKCPDIDYTTAHVWVQNWEWYDPMRHEQTYPDAFSKTTRYLRKHIRWANQLGKPLVLEEFGMSRDAGLYERESLTDQRDAFFEDLFEWTLKQAKQGKALTGINFWAWGGEGRALKDGGFWKEGAPIIGDPPHEHQGWYSVYEKDRKTLAILWRYGAEFAALTQTP